MISMNSNFRLFLKNYWILLAVIAAKFVLQYVLVNPYYELHRDEFLHLDLAKHLAFGFISVPPLTSVFSKIILLLGGSIFWVRFFPALFGALTIMFAWLITETLGGRTLSKIILSLALLFSVLLRLNILFQPNSFDIMIWTAIFWCLVNYVKTENEKWLWLLALCVSLGMYNKYSVAFMVAGLFAGLLLTEQRKIFLKPIFWKAAALALILFLPNIVWQVMHDFPVLNHMRVLKETQLDNNSVAGFLQSQVKIFAGSLPVVITALIGLFSYREFRSYRFAGIAFLVTMLIFAVFKSKDYYALGLFPPVIAFGAVYLGNITKRRLKYSLVSAFVIFNLILFASIFRLLMPVMSPEQILRNSEMFEKMGMLRWEDGKNHPLPQDFADMTGWKEMADKAYEAYMMVPGNELENTIVHCDNYGQTGAVNYYNRGRMKEAFALTTDYIYWITEVKPIKNVILVGDLPEPEILKLFREYRQTGKVENTYSREYGTGIYLFTGADSSFTKLYYGLAEKRKRELDIF